MWILDSVLRTNPCTLATKVETVRIASCLFMPARTRSRTSASRIIFTRGPLPERNTAAGRSCKRKTRVMDRIKAGERLSCRVQSRR